MARCKYCGQEIIWIRTPDGKQMPCDPGLVAYKRREKAKGRIVTKNGEVVAAMFGINIGSADGVGYEPQHINGNCQSGSCWLLRTYQEPNKTYQ